MAPLTPFWAQPSHGDIQEIHHPSNPEEFTTKSISKVELKPYAVFAKFSFPPCTVAEKPTYATVQMGKDSHLNLNSDLVYINHGCEPSLIFDMSSKTITSGPKGLSVGQELTFFYPSTEWDMAQGFDCFCGAKTCRGFISGAKNMSKKQLEGIWLNAHIRELLEENEKGNVKTSNGFLPKTNDAAEEALKASLLQAKKMVESAQNALDIYKSIHGDPYSNTGSTNGAAGRSNGASSRALAGEMGGDTRRGITSRALGGEMGGDTNGSGHV